jgi:HAMP domain-containing protein
VLTDELLVPILQGGLVALLLALVLAYALSRWVADPLQRVVIAARKYPAKTMKPLPPHGPHEVQDLTRAFNSMVARVESAQRSQRDFVANVSHELKTPLTSIQGFAQAILDGTADTPEARKQAAQVIQEEAGRISRHWICSISHACKAAPENEHVCCRCGRIIAGVSEKFSLQAQKADVNIYLQRAGRPAHLDRGRRSAGASVHQPDRRSLKFTPVNGQVTLSARIDGAWIEFDG